ncbi:hypothetical protein [Pseudoalteromonas ostreae]|uniref:hypothetical protein n=1 Tax=Pseudoalteromonas ostreae TaxID=2774154 RepID=UPI001B37D219|nr:hypothetical protein [Pseudoalteromonas ostreae]
MQLGKAFQPKGVKVVLMLLIQADLVKEPLRTIADVSEVVLGTVKQVIDDLIYQGFVVKNGQNTSLNVVSKLPRGLVELYRLINGQADALATSYLVIGATTRDIILHHGFGAVIERGTRDVDFAIQVKSWQQFELLKTKLFANGFKAHEMKGAPINNIALMMKNGRARLNSTKRSAKFSQQVVPSELSGLIHINNDAVFALVICLPFKYID